MLKELNEVSMFYFVLLAVILLVDNLQAKTLQIWVNSPTDVQYYAHMVELYQKKNPKFKAEIKHYGFKELPDKLTLAIKTSINPPDIVQIDELFFSLYLPNQIPFLDISKQFKKSKLSLTILPQRAQLFSFKDKQYGIPQSMSTVVLYYRSDLFEINNIKPEDIDTWDKFIQIGLKQKESSLIALDWSYFSILMHQRGFPIFDENGTFLSRSPQVKKMVKFFQRLKEDSIGRIPDRGHIFEPVFFQGDVKANEVMSVIGAGWYGLDMIRNFSDSTQSWKAMPLPRWTDYESNPRRTSSFSGQGLFIYKNTKQPNQSWSFIEFVMNNQEANILRYTMGNSLTANTASWFDPRLYKKDSFLKNQSLGELLLELSPQAPFIKQTPKRAIFYNLLRENFWQSLLVASDTTTIESDKTKTILDKLKLTVEQYSF